MIYHVSCARQKTDTKGLNNRCKLPESREGEAYVVGLQASEKCARAIDNSRGRIRSGYISRQPEDGLREAFELLACREMNDRQLDLRNLHRDSAIRSGNQIADLLRSRYGCTTLHSVLRAGVDTAADNRYQCGQQE